MSDSKSPQAVQTRSTFLASECWRLTLLLGLLLIGAVQRPLSAITIDAVYSTDFGGDESPSWDPDGSKLQSHFKRAVQIWERLLPSEGEFEFDFQWDNDLDIAGRASDFGFIDQFIQINPKKAWFVDPSPEDDKEFECAGSNVQTSTQTRFSTIEPNPLKTIWFPDTLPPNTLEVGFSLSTRPILDSTCGPTLSDSGASIVDLEDMTITPVDSENGLDLLSVILHEIGHMLGIGAEPDIEGEIGGEPGDFNILPHHLGGLADVTVKEDDDGGHLSDDHNGDRAFWLMAPLTPKGQRRFPSATDVLVAAEEQSLDVVRLDRVGSIDSGLWSEPSRWIGGSVPNATQDVYIRHVGQVTLDSDGFARNLLIAGVNSVDVANHQLRADGKLTIDPNGQVNVDTNGTLAAHEIVHSPGAITTATKSLVRFNDLTLVGTSNTDFNGSLAIGYDAPGVGPVTFSPVPYAQWSIAQTLRVGDENTNTSLLIDEAAKFTSGSGRIGTDMNGGGEGSVHVTGPGSSWTVNGPLDGRNGFLHVNSFGVLVTDSVTLGADEGVMVATVVGPTPASASASWTVNGTVDIGPPLIANKGQGWLKVLNQGLMTVDEDVYVHGLISTTSFVTVDSHGKLDVAGDLTVGPYGEVQLHSGTLLARSLLRFGGAFDWTDGTLELTDQDVEFDNGLQPQPLEAQTTLQNHQTLILSGAGRGLVVGQSGLGELEMFDYASVQVGDGPVFIAENAGSVGNVRLLATDTTFDVNGSMAIGGDLNNAGGQGTLEVGGRHTVTDTLTNWSTGSATVTTGGVLSADVLHHAGSGFAVQPGAMIRYNELSGFGPSITFGGISAVGIAEGNSGQGALLRNTSESYSFQEGWLIGDNALAQVDLVNGGSASGDGFVHLGNRIGSAGTILNVSGANGNGTPSQLLVLNDQDDAMIVGVADVATMNVVGGGYVVTNGGATVAQDLTASGSHAVVDGGGSEWQVAHDLTVGGNAKGLLTVQNQGLVSVGHTLFIGGRPTEETFDPDPGEGLSSDPSIATITGVGAKGVVGLDTVVGYELAGELIVKEQGELITTNTAYISQESSAGGSSVLIDQQGTWEVGKNMSVGHQAQGAMKIQNNSYVSVGSSPSLNDGNVHIASLFSAGGSSVEITSGGTWDIQNDLYVGANARGSLLIDHGAVNVADIAIIASGPTTDTSSVTVMNQAAWHVGNDLIVGDQAQGSLQIDSGATVSVLGSATVASQTSAEFSSVTVSHEGAWGVGGNLRIGDQTTGSLHVDSDGLVAVGGHAYLGGGGFSGDGTVNLVGTDESVATLSVQGILFVGGDSVGSVGKGQIGMDGRTRIEASSVAIWNDGSLRMAGVVDVGSNHVENHGMISGEGRITGALKNLGTVNPGTSSAAHIEVGTDFTQKNSGLLAIDLGGLDPLTGYDQVDITGTANLDGTLELALIEGFQPQFGDEFVPVTAGTRNGQFDQIHGIMSPGGDFALAPLYDYGNHTGLTIITALPGDANLDGEVTDHDLEVLFNNLGSGGDWSNANFDGDAVVSYADLDIILRNLGRTIPSQPLLSSASSVPEPASVVMFLIGGVLTLLPRRK